MNSAQHNFYCPSCGAQMNTDGSSSDCPYCGRQELDCAINSDSQDLDFNALETESAWAEAVNYMCDSCGVETARLSSDTIQSCPYCTSGSIMPSDKSYGIKPSMVAPFQLTTEQASSKMDDWLKKRLLSPFSFRSELLSDSMKGLFLPYWSFGAKADAEYTGQAGNYYLTTEVNTSSTGERTEAKNHRVRKVRWRMVSGSYSKIFSDIIFGDTSQIDTRVIKSLEPFKLSELVKYEDRYVAGFAVEHYKQGINANWNRAKAYMGSILRGEISAIVKRGSDVTGAVNICTKYSEISHHLMLLPVWTSTYRFRKKVFKVYINGQTGVIYGKSPVSILKIGIIVLALAAAAALLIWLI